MNLKFKLLLLPILISSFSFALSQEEYKEVCSGQLSLQKKLICEKHKKRLHLVKSRTAFVPESTKPILPKAPEKKVLKEEAKVTRISPPSIKPYIPGAYRKSSEGNK